MWPVPDLTRKKAEGSAADRTNFLRNLAEYHAKRSADRTPEPTGAVGAPGGSLFVIQKHAARQLHYDLRLELDGVLLSWAVPKGPSRNPADKHVAIQVEDHPIEYADFEGIIPQGNYGAGAVIVWDRGVWTPLEDPHEGLKKGKLLFDLRGCKLQGRWTLVKIKKSEKDWLFIKERDGYVAEDGLAFPQDSILSGLTVEELGSGTTRRAMLRAELDRLGAPKRPVRPAEVEVMLAEPRESAFSRRGWLFELKYDGYRIIASREDGSALLTTRNGNDATPTFPEVANALSKLPYENLVLDGEVVVQDELGRPSFQMLQQRGRFLRAADARRAASRHPALYYAFDFLAFEEYDLRPLPLVERKRLLRQLLPSTGILRYTDHIDEKGEAFYEAVREMKLEGIVAKKADSKYRAGRSADWQKIRIDHFGVFVIVGYTAPKGGRGGFGALHLAAYAGDELVYAGSVGTGFTTAQLSEIREQLDEHGCAKPRFSKVPPGRGHAWVEPVFVCEVRYKEWTDDGMLRHPVFIAMRPDIDAADCVHPVGEPQGHEPEAATAVAASESAIADSRAAAAGARTEPEVRFTNLDKVFFPEDGCTKGDLIEYYRGVSKWLLPYLQDRPVVLTRFPDGIHGKSFFQKDAPGFTPDWVRTEKLWSEESQRELSHFICDDLPTLLYIANSGTIPLHINSARIGSLETPDWCILDLDPKDAPFSSVIAVALATRELCEEIRLPCFVKTSGSSGLHVLIPLGAQVTHEQSKILGQLLARAIVQRAPDIATVERVVGKRAGKVYVDYLQNGHGKLLAAPFCVRPLPGAPVSMPIAWEDVTEGLDVRGWNIRNAVDHLRRSGDPLRDVLTVRPNLIAALERLARKL